MTAIKKTCITIACDVCKTPFESWDGVTWHWDDIADAKSVADEWWIHTDGTALCGKGTADHDKFATSLRPKLTPSEWEDIVSQRPYLGDDWDPEDNYDAPAPAATATA